MDNLDAMEEVNHDKRQRRYGAQDKDELIKIITKLHAEGFSQVEIANKLGFARNVNSITKKKGCSDLYLSSLKELKEIFPLLYQHGDIKLNRKYDIYSSLMR